MVEPISTISEMYGRFLANMSWICFPVAIGTNRIGKAMGFNMLHELMALVIFLMGFIIGITALALIPRQGRRGILAPALVGLILNGLFVIV